MCINSLNNWWVLHFLTILHCIWIILFFLKNTIEKSNWYIKNILEDEELSSSFNPNEMKADGYRKQPWYDQADSSVSWEKGNYGDSQQNHQHNWFH